MNWADWYTDTMDVYRVEAVADGSLTRNERKPVLEGIKCRVYTPDKSSIRMQQTAADVQGTEQLACDISIDIRAGDELIITRGAVLGKTLPVIRAFAGDPRFYYEPFGAVMPGLAHQEIPLLRQERAT